MTTALRNGGQGLPEELMIEVTASIELDLGEQSAVVGYTVLAL